MNSDTMKRWIRVSHKIASIFDVGSHQQRGSVLTLQQLARFEQDIDKLDEEFQHKSQEGIFKLDSIATYTSLWVLGAYEITRALAHITEDSGLKSVRDQFARLRIPLAKLEASHKHKETDWAFPFPVLFPKTRAIGWAVNSHVIVTRKELSEALLNALEILEIEKRTYKKQDETNVSRSH